MFELSLGFILAFWFVTFYFIYRKVFSHDTSDAPRLPPAPPRELDGRTPRPFLNAADLSEHHNPPRRPDYDEQ